MEKNLPSQTIRPLPPPIKVLSRLRAHLCTSAALFGKKWYYGTNLQAIDFLVYFEVKLTKDSSAVMFSGIMS